MTPRPAVLLYPAALAGIAALLYAAACHRQSTNLLRKLAGRLEPDIASTQETYRVLKRQRSPPKKSTSTLCPSQKGLQKPHPKPLRINGRICPIRP